MTLLHSSRKPDATANLRQVFHACFLLAMLFALPQSGQANGADAQTLLQKLATADAAEAEGIARDIRRHWSNAESATANLLLKRGKDALRAKKTEVAIEHLTALTDHAPDFAEGWHLRASAYFQAQLIGPALDDLARVLELNPNHFEAMRGLGAIFEHLGDYERAYLAYSQVLTIHPFHEEAGEARQRLELKVKGPAL